MRFWRCHAHGQNDQAKAVDLQITLDFEAGVQMQKTPEIALDFGGEDKLAGEKHQMRMLVSKLAAEPDGFQHHIGPDRGFEFTAADLVCWALMLAMPFPYIATTAGWMTAELGRQPWLVYGLMRTAEGTSPRVSAGNTLFTLIGFSGLYLVIGILFLYLVGREIAHGPGTSPPQPRMTRTPGLAGEAG